MLKWVQLLHPQQQQQPQSQNREGAKQVKITVRLLDILWRIPSCLLWEPKSTFALISHMAPV
jgi:hypothetical protein